MSFAASTEAQDNAVELVVDQARRLAGPRLAAVIATSSRPLGGETTVTVRDAALAMSDRHPAVDLLASGTLRPELLV